jgi:DNA-binding transcriptional regulator YdaS (Cro superfamily)
MDAATRDAVLKKASRGAIARELGINLSAVSRWFKRGQIPAERCAAVEAITGVPRHLLRPDLYIQPKPRRRA